MNQKRKLTLQLAIAGCFGLVASQAHAVVVLGTNSVPFASEVVPTATLTNAAGLLDVDINTVPGYVATTAQPMFVKVALLNGVVFGAAPTMTCLNTGATTTAAVISLGGGVGANSVTFRVTAGEMRATATCTMSAATYTISGTTTKTISAQVEYTDGLTPATIARTGNFITFSRGLVTTVSAPTTNLTVDATSGSDNWAAGNNLTIGTGYAGRIIYGVAGVTAFGSAGAANIENVDAVSAAGSSVTISGPAVAAALAIGNSGVYLSTVSGCADTGVAAVFQASGSSTVTFNNITPAQLSAGMFVCMRNPGNVLISTGQLTASVTPAPIGSTTRVLDGSTSNPNLANVNANGSTRNAYFMNASTSTSKTSILRLVNRSGIAGNVTMTCYNEAGTVAGTPNVSLGSLAPNQMLSRTSAEVEGAGGCNFTVSGPTAKYSVVFSGALPSFEVLNFARDITTGAITLSNTSTTDTR